MRIRHLKGPTIVLVGTLLLCLHAPGVSALILDSRDGAGNATRPDDDPGWDYVGKRLGGPTVVYLGHGWVLTAHHVGVGTVLFDEKTYQPVRDSITQMKNADGSFSDLIAFQLIESPDLPVLPIAKTTPKMGEEVIMIGTGKSRGENLTVDVEGRGLVDGWKWADYELKQWGTNLIANESSYIEHAGTRTLSGATLFDRIDDPNGTRQEAQAAVGDSGGALFARADRYDKAKGWVLAGIMFSISSIPQQPNQSTLYGNPTFFIDLSNYRSQIIPLVRPECSNERDDDGDGQTDYPADRSCQSPSADDESLETPPDLALLWMGAGLFSALAFSGLMLWRRRV